MVDLPNRLTTPGKLRDILEQTIVYGATHHEFEGDQGKTEQVGREVLVGIGEPLGRRIPERVYRWFAFTIVEPREYVHRRQAIADDDELTIRLH
ncbi:MAG: hypothetical protein GWP91_19525 [Rhodobacterales bacterium]|nr:hypothetical protein [Rhodobacterales bacterium]